jgi:xylulokinase
MTLLLGLDLGTTTTKCVLYDASWGRIVRAASQPTPVDHPQPGWSEHDPHALWQTAVECIREAASGADTRAIRGIAISSMAEAGLLVDSGGAPLAPAIAWYDRRSETQAAQVEARFAQDALYRITGQRVSPSFGLTKILWMRAHLPHVFALAARWLPLPAYLLYRLSGAQMIDATIASRTLLFDQRTLGWSAEILRAFDLPESLLPPTAIAGAPAGPLTGEAAAALGLPPGVMCVLGGHDHLCAALAAGAAGPGNLVDSTGTANALLLLLPRFLPDATLADEGYASYASLLPELWALKGGLKAAGSAVEWLARGLAGGRDPDYPALEAAAAAGVGRKAGPLWLPHWIGSGTPHGDRFSRAALVGAQIEHGPADLFRGLLESLAFWTRQNVERMETLAGLPPQENTPLALTGGAARLRLLAQLKADVLRRPARIPAIPESAAAGAALLAGIGCGVFRGGPEAAASLRYPVETIDPDLTRAGWYDDLYTNAYLPLYRALRPVHQALARAEEAGKGHRR